MNPVTPAPPVPVPDPDSTGYWEATREGKLMLCRCVDTGTWIHPPQERSPSGGKVRFEEVSGRGTVFSFIVVRHQTVPGRRPPYVVGVIELDEQPGLRLTGVIEADPLEVEVGARVRARLVDLPPAVAAAAGVDSGVAGLRAPQFELVTT
ncbi:Zn-ribbon domain-containing OB-fold protein [Pseudonocardia parietis]|uniref:Zn-ribbon domain-containing OB-fold protein n=1 Tax=Pseudonocardia parietis TaxID=570936 RepID=UPI001AE4A3FB